MKTPLPRNDGPPCGQLAAVLILVLSSLALSAQAAPAARDHSTRSDAGQDKPVILDRLEVNASISPAKDYTLFVGTDLAVKQEGTFYRVVDATKDVLKVEKDHRVADLRIGEGANIRVSRGVKLSNLTASIDNLQTHSVDRAAARAQLEAMQTSMALDEVAHSDVDLAFGGVAVLSSVAVNMNSPSYENIQALKQAAFDHYSEALHHTDPLSNNSNAYLIDKLGGTGQSTSIGRPVTPASAPEVELEFAVSSPGRLEHAYVVVVATYGFDDKPDKIAQQLSVRDFKQLDAVPRRVTMHNPASVQDLPFKKFDIALFANGQEVATNLSQKRMPLTAEQAYQFFLIDYLTAHKGASVPPAPMLMTPRAEFRQQVAHAAASQPIYVTVDKSGAVLSLSLDQSGAEKVPASIAATLQNVRFMPALNNGTPVDGHLKLTLAELAN